ncbi:MAG: thiamine-monophosphate kinase [bacterium]|nr:thiamine-monophosphate kinase [bacterium]
MHRWLARREKPANLRGSMMHDAAVLERTQGRLALCVDQTIEGVHFESDAAAARVGAKAAGRALSDLAATAATPLGLVCALSAPPETDESWIQDALSGVADAFQLVGGDLACAPGPRALSVTALGTVAADVPPPARDRARAGDTIVLTGPVGGSPLGRHLDIVPRLRAGRWLFGAGCVALMDVSDGLAWDLFRFARTAGVQFVVDSVPVHADAARLAEGTPRSALDHALHDGEDHELIACVPQRALARVLDEAPRECSELTVIGRVQAGAGLVLELDGESRQWTPGEGGWRHGA